MGESSRGSSYGGLRVVVAGGGVAGLETMLALRELAGDLVDIRLLSPEHHFWYRPTSVAEPFGLARTHRFELAGLTAAVGAEFVPGALAAVDTDSRLARASTGSELPYDVLVVACGTVQTAALEGALTFRGPSDTDALRVLLGEIEDGTATRIAFALPRGTGWPLPLYELALLTAAHVEDLGVDDVELALVTYEPAPLAVLGPEATEAVEELLARHGVTLHTGSYAVSFTDGRLELLPAGAIVADRVVALARLHGQAIAGIPQDAEGFISTEWDGRVAELEDVYAAGDITRFPIKQGGIATQQADLVAEAIAGRAGAELRPEPFEPVLHALLLTGREPLYLRTELRGGYGSSCTVSRDPLLWPPAKIAGRYLAPFLAAHGALELTNQ